MRKHYPLNSNGVEDAGQLPWTDGVPSTGVQGSYPGQAIVTDTEAEVLAAIDAAGYVRSGTDKTQLAQAISRGIYLGGYTGSANALAAILPNSVQLPSLVPGMRIAGIASATNTGAVTVTIAGFTTPPGTLQLLRRDGAAMKAGDIPVGAPFDIRFDGSAFRMSVPTISEIGVAATTVINSKLIVGGVPKPYSVPGTYTLAIAANTTFQCIVRGAGGGGGGCTPTGGAGGSGGGGGGYSLKVVTATVDAVVQIVVGAPGQGGTGGSSPTGGTAGGTSSISVVSGSVTDGTNTYTAGQVINAATGGGPGQGGNGGLQSTGFGSSGIGSGGDLNKPGDTGGFPYAVGSGVIGGSGGASPYSGSSPGPNLSAHGITSSAAGVGGNGDSGGSGGGNGSPGEVVIYK